MENQWVGFDDFELAQLCFDYGIQDDCVFSGVIPVKLANRNEIEALLTAFELELAFGE